MAIPAKDFEPMEAQVRTEVLAQSDIKGYRINILFGYIVLKTAFRLWAIMMNRLYPEWEAKLPMCPTHARQSEEEFTDCRGVAWVQSNTLLWLYHPLASFSTRTKEPVYLTYDSMWGGTYQHGHGQQCCYNSAGELLTSGGGAGTPDFFSPATTLGFLGHMLWDVMPWWFLGDAEYKQYWVPNSGQGCGGTPQTPQSDRPASSGRIEISLENGPVMDDGSFRIHVGDRVKVHVQVNASCPFRLIHRDGEGKATALAPAKGESAILQPDRRYSFPQTPASFFRVTEPAGAESFELECGESTVSTLRYLVTE
jgi:hypothetical protein